VNSNNKFPMSGQSVNEVPIHDVKFMVWSALSATRLTEPALRLFAKQLRNTTISFVFSVCPSARNSLTPTGRIFRKNVFGTSTNVFDTLRF
jgi:hypothetical protein